MYPMPSSPDAGVVAHVAITLSRSSNVAISASTRVRGLSVCAVRAARPDARPGDEWVLLTAGFPWTHGELAQDRGIWGVLAWASARPGIAGVIVGDAGDYGTRRGLRGPGGRLRLANTSLRRAIRGLNEAAR